MARDGGNYSRAERRERVERAAAPGINVAVVASLLDPVEVLSMSEEEARETFILLRYDGAGPSCPACGNPNVYHLSTRRTFRCADTGCMQVFSAKMGTLFERAKLTYRQILLALAAFHDGMSASELGRQLGIGHKSATDLRAMLMIARGNRDPR